MVALVRYVRARILDGPAVDDPKLPVDGVLDRVRLLEVRIEPLRARNLLLDDVQRDCTETHVNRFINKVRFGSDSNAVRTPKCNKEIGREK